jgi:hypothetical protein
VIAILFATPLRLQTASIPAWYGYAGNPQHTGVSSVSAGNMAGIKWSAPVDLYPQSAGNSHYASPSITAANTVVIGVKTGESDGFELMGVMGQSGNTLWTLPTDYSVPTLNETGWTSVYPMGLVESAALGAGGGGTVNVWEYADNPRSAVNQLCFYQPYKTYAANPALYAGVKINTPFTGDTTGDFWFGYRVYGGNGLPAAVQNELGTGGIVRMTLSGTAAYVPAVKLVPSNKGDDCRPNFNAAPALSNDGKSIYVSIANTSQGRNYLVKLDSTSLKVLATVRLLDAANNADVWVCTCSSASPMVAPDNQVFYGVLRNNDGSSHGWMLQFDANLKQTNASGVRYPVGAFGWDDTPAVVPSSAVLSYTGKSPYLILTKYNNYYGLAGGDGRNHLAILDPKNNNLTKDRITKIPTMNEIELLLGLTCDSDFYPCTRNSLPNVNPAIPVREWCINAAAVDPIKRQAIINSEDGSAYRWDFDTNKVSQAVNLAPATGEPYTCTAIGPDGTAYAINDGALNAIFAVFATPPQ